MSRKHIFILSFMVFIPFIGISKDFIEPTINFLPSNYILDNSGGDSIRIDVSTNARYPDAFLDGVKKINLKTIRLNDGKTVDSKELENIIQLKKYVFKPEIAGDYRLFVKATMKSNYIFDDSFQIKVVDIEVPPLPLLEIEVDGTGSFSLAIPLPDLVYNALDLAFVIDNSGSMANEILATKLASKDIFQRLKLLAGDVKASVTTFSSYEKKGNVYGLGDYGIVIPPTFNPIDFENIPTKTGGGNEFQYFALYKTASTPSLWREGAVKFLVLMTDEMDNAYCNAQENCNLCNHSNKLKWEGSSKLSIIDIEKYLDSNDFSVAVIFNEIDGQQCYGDTLQNALKDKFAGAYRIQNDAVEKNEIVEKLYSSFSEIVKSAVVKLEPMEDDKKFVKKITPISPIDCIVNGGFNYGCAKKNGSEMKYIVNISGKKRNIRRYNFLLVVKTNKGSLVSVKPISLLY